MSRNCRCSHGLELARDSLLNEIILEEALGSSKILSVLDGFKISEGTERVLEEVQRVGFQDFLFGFGASPAKCPAAAVG